MIIHRIHPSIHFAPLIVHPCLQGLLEPNPSCLGVKVEFHPEQVASSSQGHHTETNAHPHSHSHHSHASEQVATHPPPTPYPDPFTTFSLRLRPHYGNMALPAPQLPFPPGDRKMKSGKNSTAPADDGQLPLLVFVELASSSLTHSSARSHSVVPTFSWI